MRSLLFGTGVHSHKMLIVTASRRRSDHVGRADPRRPRARLPERNSGDWITSEASARPTGCPGLADELHRNT